MNILQRKIVANAFIMSQFSYCPLIWMFRKRAMEQQTKQNSGKESKLKPTQNQPIFKEVLEKIKSDGIHQRNLQTLATEIYEAKKKDLS